MKRSLFAVLGIALAVITGLVATAGDGGGRTRHRIVFEVTSGEPEHWNGLLNNVENVRRALGENRTDVQVVAHGGALGLMLAGNEKLAARMKTLATAGVVFAACENTMRRQKVSKDQLFPFVTTVDSGVAEIVRKQEAGWSYVRAGG